MFSRDGRGTRWSRRGKLALAALAGAVIVAVPAAWAGHMFSDVPDAYPHHDDISAIALAGITTGKTCTPPGTPPTYCPEEGVTRGQMASFPRRGMGRLSFRGTSLRPVPTSEAAWDSYPIRPGLPAGALAGAAGFIKADSTITVRLTNATGCPCRIRGSLWIQDQGLMVAFLTNVTLTTVGEEKNLAMTGARAVSTSGTKRVEIRLWQDVGSGSAEAYGNSTATYFPFGSQGTNVLDPP